MEKLRCKSKLKAILSLKLTFKEEALSLLEDKITIPSKIITLKNIALYEKKYIDPDFAKKHINEAIYLMQKYNYKEDFLQELKQVYEKLSAA